MLAEIQWKTGFPEKRVLLVEGEWWRGIFKGKRDFQRACDLKKKADLACES